MLAGVTDCRRSWKWGCRGRLVLGFKPRHGSHARRGPHSFGREGRGPHSFGTVGWGHVALVEWGPRDFGRESGPRGFGLLLFATRLRKQERLCREEKGRQDSCWWAMRRRHIVGNCSKCGKCGSAPTQKSQWGARLAGRTHVHG